MALWPVTISAVKGTSHSSLKLAMIQIVNILFSSKLITHEYQWITNAWYKYIE